MESQAHAVDETIFKLLDRKALAKVLTRDVTVDWRQLICMYTSDLVDYIFKNIIIDTSTNTIDIFNSADISELLVS